MNDNQVFGVEGPAAGEVAWCAVLGMTGEVFGLAAYLGAAGLGIHRRIQSGKLGPDSDEIRSGFPCLLTSFENRQELDANDLSLILSLRVYTNAPDALRERLLIPASQYRQRTDSFGKNDRVTGGFPETCAFSRLNRESS